MANKDALRILFVTSEVSPFSKTGGLADVSSALPHALTSLGCDVRVLSPRYGFIDPVRFGIVPEDSLPRPAIDIRGQTIRASLCRAEDHAAEPRYLMIECDPLYDRPGVYVDPFTNRDYIDNDYRFILLCRIAAQLAESRDWSPQIIHCNDWQTALVPFYLSQMRRIGKLKSARSVMTIHNIAYHGLFGTETVPRIGDAEKYFYPGGPFEFYGHVNFLKAGLEFSDTVNTVSPTYAKEIQSGYEYGYGLDTVLRARGGDVTGILNGIDVDLWNPESDPHISARFSSESLPQKEINKRALCERLGLTYDEAVPVIGIISRIAVQKGFEIIVPIVEELLNLPARIVMLGAGDPHFEHIFSELGHRHPEHMAVRIGYDEDLAHVIEAGCDMFLMPSRYEPCGLNQMMSMRYGTIPVVRATGGLADTVLDADDNPAQGTGFSFAEYSSEALLRAVRRAVAAFHDRNRWRTIQCHAMRSDFSWCCSARRYVELYEKTLMDKPRTIE